MSHQQVRLQYIYYYCHNVSRYTSLIQVQAIWITRRYRKFLPALSQAKLNERFSARGQWCVEIMRS